MVSGNDNVSYFLIPSCLNNHYPQCENANLRSLQMHTLSNIASLAIQAGTMNSSSASPTMVTPEMGRGDSTHVKVSCRPYICQAYLVSF